ncbi:MAG TPA: response regulator transcription factor [Thermoanaerobaculia bacterium]|nr:response regulator transcription factor [Thermoanaerobaculia bacterium]
MSAERDPGRGPARSAGGASARPRVLVVEDEPHLAEGIADNLEAEGYEPAIAADGAAGLERLLSRRFDLGILDVMLPELDGFAVCRMARERGVETPILFLTARGGVDDRVRGLRAGGDDYLAKPFHLEELMLRVKAILRRAGADEASSLGSRLEFGGNRVDLDAYMATAWNGERHELTHKEAMILRVLAERRGAVVSRDTILDRVWGYDLFPSSRTIDNFIVRLRRRFERHPERPRHFHTVRGVGYRFTVDENE